MKEIFYMKGKNYKGLALIENRQDEYIYFKLFALVNEEKIRKIWAKSNIDAFCERIICELTEHQLETVYPILSNEPTCDWDKNIDWVLNTIDKE